LNQLYRAFCRPVRSKRQDKSKNNFLVSENREINQNAVIDTQEKPDMESQGIDGNGIKFELTNNASNEVTVQPTIEDWQQEIDGNENGSLSASTTLIELPEVMTIDSNSEEPQQIPKNIFAINPRSCLSKKPTTIHIIDGEKEGCGKSFICRAFIEYCNSTARDMMIIDADTSNRDIEKIYPNVESAFFSDDEKQAYEADKIFDFAFDKSVLVNLPAQVYGNVTNWIKRNDLINLGNENSINFAKWFVATGGIDSVNFSLKSLDDFGDDITHVFIKNYGLCDNWEYVETMPEFVDAARKYNFHAIDFPKFPFWERNTIDRLGITFTDAVSCSELKIVSKQRVKNFLQFAYKAFAKTGLIE
jgi:hypothetical protein